MLFCFKKFSPSLDRKYACVWRCKFGTKSSPLPLNSKNLFLKQLLRLYIFNIYIYVSKFIYSYVQEGINFGKNNCNNNQLVFYNLYSKILYWSNSTYVEIYINLKRRSSIPPYVTRGKEILHHTCCNCRNTRLLLSLLIFTLYNRHLLPWHILLLKSK